MRGDKNSLTYRYPIAVSSSFGLLHGFGFAAVLGETGLPQTEIPTALLFFNLGVEAGQIIFVAAVVLAYQAVRLAGNRFFIATSRSTPCAHCRSQRPMQLGS